LFFIYYGHSSLHDFCLVGPIFSTYLSKFSLVCTYFYTIHFVMCAFCHPVILSSLETRLYHMILFCCSTVFISLVPSLFLKSLHMNPRWPPILGFPISQSIFEVLSWAELYPGLVLNFVPCVQSQKCDWFFQSKKNCKTTKRLQICNRIRRSHIYHWKYTKSVRRPGLRPKSCSGSLQRCSEPIVGGRVLPPDSALGALLTLSWVGLFILWSL